MNYMTGISSGAVLAYLSSTITHGASCMKSSFPYCTQDIKLNNAADREHRLLGVDWQDNFEC